MNENNDLYRKLTAFIQEVSSKQTEDIKNHMKKEVEEIKETLNKEIAKRTELDKELQELKSKHKILEKELRKNNIIIFNLDYKGENNILDYTVEKLNQLLQTNITKESVNNIYEIGKKKENKPIIVKFTSYITKQEILKSCKKLKGTNIGISEELTLDERKKQKILRQHLKKARSKKCTAYIKGDKLYVNEEEYKAEDLLDNEEDSENEQEENAVVELQTSNSAPATPTPKTKIQEALNIDEQTREEKGAIPKKRKPSVTTNNTLPGRSSSRIIQKELK